LEISGSPSSSPARGDAVSVRQKISAIRRACNCDPVDIDTLKQLAISRGGLLNNEIRKKVYPKLLEFNMQNISPKPDEETLKNHRDYQQVVLDVNRSLKRFPPGMEEEERMSLQDEMVEVICRVLVAQPELHYYQGYHDICVTFLLVVGEDMTFAVMEKLSQNHLRDFMDKTMDKTNSMLNYLYPVIGKASPDLRAYMDKAEVGTIFCLSWLITWYGHVLSEFEYIVRLYDFFIACPPLMPIYLAAAIVLYREKDVLAAQCEMPIIHSLLSRIPDELPMEQLINKAGDLYVQFPPVSLEEEIAQQVQERKKKEEAYQAQIEANKQRMANNKKSQKQSRLPVVKFSFKQSNAFVNTILMVVLAAVSTGGYYALRHAGWKWFDV